MVYERKLKTLEELSSVLNDLETDTGIRLRGRVDGVDSFIFITRHTGRFAVWTRPRRTTVGGAFREFFDKDSLWPFLTQVASKPVSAYVY